MKRWLLILIPIIALGTAIAWRLKGKRADVQAQTTARAMRAKTPPMVNVEPAAVRDVLQLFEGIGAVESPFSVKIASKVTGRIEFLQVREGDRVTAGEVLVRFDPSEIEAQVRQRDAELAESRSRLVQAQLTQEPANSSVATEIKKQEAAVASAKADYRQAAQNSASILASKIAAVTDAQGRIDAADASIGNAQAGIRNAEANLENAKAKFNRIQTLYNQGFIAAQDVDDARTTVSVAQGALDVAKSLLNSAKAQRDSAAAQKHSAEEDVNVGRTTSKANIDAAAARVQQAEAALEYAKVNVAQKPAYQANLAALRSSVAAAEANLHNAQAQSANTVLKSPLNGYVTGRYVDLGATAMVGQPILAVQEVKALWVTVPVREEVSSKIATGRSAEVTFDALPGRNFTGTVIHLNPSSDPQSHQLVMRLSVDNSHNLLKPGMFARVRMELERTSHAVSVPREAVLFDKRGAYVTVVDSSKTAHRRPVILGASDTEGYAITSGLDAGESVVVLSAAPLKDNQVVRVTASTPAAGQ